MRVPRGDVWAGASCRFVSKQKAQVQEGVAAAFNDLMKGIERNLEVENRRKFLRNVQAYRQQMKAVEELNLD